MIPTHYGGESPRSPNGATVNSQGCQPLAGGALGGKSQRDDSACTIAPLGLKFGICALPRGSRPWLLTVAPLGLLPKPVSTGLVPVG
jgi:hypothetical protein